MTSIISFDYVLLFFSVYAGAAAVFQGRKLQCNYFICVLKFLFFSIKNNSKIKSLSPFPVLSVCVCVRKCVLR